MADTKALSCWCGVSDLAPFSEFYRRCSQCNTLVSIVRRDADFYKGGDSDTDLYGKEYWTQYVKKLGFPDIYERSRADLSERALFWLRSILKYRLPPAKTLELGCAHGGSVYLQRLAGYEAAGAEMSPWLCEFAKSTFQIPMLCGDIEDIGVLPASLDVVIFMDVLEHFTDPLESLNRIVKTLSDDGILVIQTPAFRSVGKSYAQMRAEGEMFLLHMKEDEHIYLFNEESIKSICARLGLHFIAFESPIYAYDMFVFASKHPFKINSSEKVTSWLTTDPSKRLVLALLDLYNMSEDNKCKLLECKERTNKLLGLQNNLNTANDLLASQRFLLKESSELEAIKNSFTWKLTAPLRKYCDKLLRVMK